MAKLVSMTGFGHAQGSVGPIIIAVELRGVNHRFLDLVWKLPPAYTAYEAELVPMLRNVLKRGRVEISVSRFCDEGGTSAVKINQELFKAALSQAKSACDSAALAIGARIEDLALTLLQRREIMEISSEAELVADEVTTLKSVLDAALLDLQKMRLAEGARLSSELHTLSASLKSSVARISELSNVSIPEIQKRMEERLAKLLQNVEFDRARLLQEAALFADRSDVTEELTRLQSHLSQLDKFIDQGEGGKKIEFLLQEIGREVNTCGSKSQGGEIAMLIVDCKAILEKIREQIQNIE